jgi:hypothetical protein
LARQRSVAASNLPTLVAGRPKRNAARPLVIVGGAALKVPGGQAAGARARDRLTNLVRPDWHRLQRAYTGGGADRRA